MEENGRKNLSPEQLASELRDARVRRDLSIEDIGRELGIGAAYLEQIESGDFAFMPPVYVLAYIKEYAKFLGVGSPETFEQCRELLFGSRQAKLPSPASDSGWTEGYPLDAVYRKNRLSFFSLKRLLVFALAAAAAVALFFAVRMFFTPSSSQESVLSDSPDVLIDADTAAVAERIIDSEFLPDLVSSADSLSRDSAAVHSARSRTDVRSALIAKEIARLADSGKVAAAGPAGGKVLEVRIINDQTWVKVIADDSARVYAGGQFKKGDVLRYEAKNKFWINIGRPSYVELYLDGKKIPPFSERTRVFQ